jgi:hypothetical protein
LLPARKCRVPNRANQPTGLLERGSWRQARDRGIRAGLKRTRGTHHRSRWALLRAEFDAPPRTPSATAPLGRHPRTQATRSRLYRRWLSSSWRRNFVIGRTAMAFADLGRWNCTTIGTYLFQTETIRYREISDRKGPYDGRLLPHCCHRAVERVVSVVIRSQRWELRDACAVYRSLPGWKPYADFRHRAGRGCSLGAGLCVRIFGKMGGF